MLSGLRVESLAGMGACDLNFPLMDDQDFRPFHSGKPVGKVPGKNIEELRVAHGDEALARAQAAAESALADLLSSPADSDFLSLPRGASRVSVRAHAGDTVRVTVQPLGGGLGRVVTAARSWSGGVRADVGTLALLRAVPDSTAAPATLRFHRIPGWWWAPVP